MFGLMYNLYQYCRKKSEKRITLVLLGLDNAGKTTLLNTIKGDLEAETTPTFGFSSQTLSEGRYKIDIFDLGGGKNIRTVWKRYLAEVHGVVFVVDAADPQRFDEAKTALEETLTSDFLLDKPLLIFANKQDLPTAATAAEVAKSLGLVELRQNRYNIMPCRAKVGPGQSVDGRTREGIKWLSSAIDDVWGKLDGRVQIEAEQVRQDEARKKKEREERAKKAREERHRLQKEEEEQAMHKENLLGDGQQASSLPPLGPGLPNQIDSPKPVPSASQTHFSDLRQHPADQEVNFTSSSSPASHSSPAYPSQRPHAHLSPLGLNTQDISPPAAPRPLFQPEQPESSSVSAAQRPGSAASRSSTPTPQFAHDSERKSDNGKASFSGRNKVAPLEVTGDPLPAEGAPA